MEAKLYTPKEMLGLYHSASQGDVEALFALREGYNSLVSIVHNIQNRGNQNNDDKEFRADIVSDLQGHLSKQQKNLPPEMRFVIGAFRDIPFFQIQAVPESQESVRGALDTLVNSYMAE